MHRHPHAFDQFLPRAREGLTLATRRNLLKAGLAGLGGLTAPVLMRLRAEGAAPRGKSVILLWMAGGPSHLDTLDPKPDRPPENRGPFGVARTRLPGVLVCEHLPKVAGLLDRLTLVRSVDCRHSNHEPNTVFQTGRLDAEPRTNREAVLYPALGAVAARFRGPNRPGVPAYAAFVRSRTHVAVGGHLGRAYDPFPAERAARLPVYTTVGQDTGRFSGGGLFELPAGLDADRLGERRRLAERFDRLRADLDRSGVMAALGRYEREAVELVAGGRVRAALDLDNEPAAVRERYGGHLWCRQALLARRLVEAGVAFVTLDLSYHPASGTWDTHGDNIPPYGGIRKGLGPLLPLFDHLFSTLVDDLGQRGLLDDVLVIAMGEFGRTPKLGTQGSTDGRDHWPVVMSMLLAGGGLRHGQVVGSTTADGGFIRERPVTPGDLAATVYQFLGVPLDAVYHDAAGRPRPVLESGRPVAELF